MDIVRGILMIAVGAFALYRGLLFHTGRSWLAVVLGLAAIALGVWRLTRKPAKPRL